MESSQSGRFAQQSSHGTNSPPAPSSPLVRGGTHGSVSIRETCFSPLPLESYHALTRSEIRPNRLERGIGQSLGNRNLLLHGCAPGHWIGSRDTSGNAARNQR